MEKNNKFKNAVFTGIFKLLQMTKINNKGGFMFEKFRFENLSKIIQLYVLNLFGQIIKKDNLEIFSKISLQSGKN